MQTLPERYRAFGQRLEDQATLDDTIYHYTTWQGLKGILETRQLWLSNYEDLNDTSEIQFAKDKIASHILGRKIKKHIQPFWGTVFSFLEGFIKTEVNFFTFSFCKAKNYLYAWRAYSNDGKGFAIGFKKDFFIGLTESIENGPNFTRGKIFYTYEEIAATIDELAELVEADYEKMGASNNPATQDELAKYFLTTIFPYLSTIKHEAYEGEHEYRIYTMQPKNQNAQKLYIRGIQESAPHFDSKQRLFFSFALENISEIWVGPQLNFEHARQEITTILNSLDIDPKTINILKSDIPYRNP